MGNDGSRQFMDGRAFVMEHDIRPSGVVYRNPEVETLYQAAVQRGSGQDMQTVHFGKTPPPISGELRSLPST